ncbi:MAG: helix-turn-helix domain-containing protein [Alphaproteobacteria bacterium]
MSPTQVAEYLGVSVPVVYRLIRANQLEAIKVGAQWRVTREVLLHFLEGSISVE